eukprot:5834060-Prymnesium_polylepis.1
MTPRRASRSFHRTSRRMTVLLGASSAPTPRRSSQKGRTAAPSDLYAIRASPRASRAARWPTRLRR